MTNGYSRHANRMFSRLCFDYLVVFFPLVVLACLLVCCSFTDCAKSNRAAARSHRAKQMAEDEAANIRSQDQKIHTQWSKRTPCVFVCVRPLTRMSHPERTRTTLADNIEASFISGSNQLCFEAGRRKR